MDSLKVLDPEGPIREAVMGTHPELEATVAEESATDVA